MTSELPDSFEVYASHLPSGDNEAYPPRETAFEIRRDFSVCLRKHAYASACRPALWDSGDSGSSPDRASLYCFNLLIFRPSVATPVPEVP
jgi:hypothetical protein